MHYTIGHYFFSFIHSFHNYLLSTKNARDTTLGPRDSAESKLDLLLVFKELKTRKKANVHQKINKSLKGRCNGLFIHINKDFFL